MTEQVQVAVIAVGGVVIGGVLNAVVQFFVTRQILQAEFNRSREQVIADYRFRMLERRSERIVEIVAELVTITDPTIETQIDYAKAVRLIHRVQLLLDRNNAHEGFLNDRINTLGYALAIHTKSPDAALAPERFHSLDLRAVHGEVIDAMQTVVLAVSRDAR